MFGNSVFYFSCVNFMFIYIYNIICAFNNSDVFVFIYDSVIFREVDIFFI